MPLANKALNHLLGKDIPHHIHESKEGEREVAGRRIMGRKEGRWGEDVIGSREKWEREGKRREGNEGEERREQ